ncbi:MAG TPA: signal peptidase II [Patescibacteria group bacterium]|nr:signal peptidase II [Patescibacteria group bacterium]
MTHKQTAFVGALAIILTIADTAAKLVAIQILPENGSIPVLGKIVGLQLHKNEGIVANIAVPMPIIVILTFAILGGLVYWLNLAWKKNERWVVASLLVLILGAAGNLVDRIAHGFTTDYIILFGRSVINLADIMIVLGVVGLLTSPTKK